MRKLWDEHLIHYPKIANGNVKVHGIKIEKYTATRIKFIRAVQTADEGKPLNNALVKYVAQRRELLVTMHRLFDDEGFNWMRETFEGDSDKDIVELIKTKIERGEDLGIIRRRRREFSLLVDNSKDFIPCYARDRIEQAKTVALSGDVFQVGAKTVAQ